MKTGVHYGLDFAVYRTLPTHCHAEMCVMVLDATKPVDLKLDTSNEGQPDYVEQEPSACQQS